MHAKVRAAILRNYQHHQNTNNNATATAANYYDVKKYGIPINQEDMAATLLAFSTNVLMGVSLLAGRPVPEQEKRDYLALWRYLGWLLGVETVAAQIPTTLDTDVTFRKPPPLDPCGPGRHHDDKKDTSIENSNGIFQSIIFHLLEPDESSVEISHHLLKACIRTSPFYFRSMLCRRMIGHELADALELPYHPHTLTRISIQFLSTLVLVAIRSYTLLAMVAPSWSPFKCLSIRSRIVQWHTQKLMEYHDKWMATHKSKMAYALRRKRKSSFLDDVHNSNDTTDTDTDTDTDTTCTDSSDDDKIDIDHHSSTSITADSVCPFAMTAKPCL